jgi:transposase-like protein
MPARKEYTPEFKDQAVRFVLEEIWASPRWADGWL